MPPRSRSVAPARLRSVTTFAAVVTRADGTVEDLGVIASTAPTIRQRIHFARRRWQARRSPRKA